MPSAVRTKRKSFCPFSWSPTQPLPGIPIFKPLANTLNDHPGSNPLQDHSYMPQGTQKKVTGESAKKSGRPRLHNNLLESMRFIQDDATNHRSSHATNDNNETNSTSVDLSALRRKRCYCIAASVVDDTNFEFY